MKHLHDRDIGNVTEDTPLIQEIPEGSRPSSSPPTTPAAPVPSIADINVPKVRSSYSVVNLLATIIFVAASSGGFIQIPLTRLIEDAFCHQYYNERDNQGLINEDLCKEPPIQSNVAFVFAISSAIDAVVGFSAALPWGIVADRIGRKPVFALALLGVALNSLWWIVVLWLYPILPIWVGWVASVTLLIGGGSAVLLAVISGMVADVAAEDERAILFMRIHMASWAGSLTSPALSSAMINVSGPWPVMWVGIACLLTSAIAVMFVPETLHRKHPFKAEHHPFSLKDDISRAFGQLKDSFSILKAPLILLFAASLLTQPIFFSTIQLLIQYTSKRYKIKIKDSGYFQAIYGAVQVFQALIGLPLISSLLTDKRPWLFRVETTQQRDLSLARWSFLILVPGVFILGAAPTLTTFIFGLIILGIGSGYGSFITTLASLYVDQEHRSRLFSLIGMLNVIGSLYSGPMLAGLFSLGMKLGGNWIGLPYFVLASMLAIASVLLYFVHLPRMEGEEASSANPEDTNEHSTGLLAS